jgi:hypothetical protein
MVVRRLKRRKSMYLLRQVHNVALVKRRRCVQLPHYAYGILHLHNHLPYSGDRTRNLVTIDGIIQRQ